jgi:hypothetical protein
MSSEHAHLLTVHLNIFVRTRELSIRLYHGGILLVIILVLTDLINIHLNLLSKKAFKLITKVVFKSEKIG